jgi:hypothetical protein
LLPFLEKHVFYKQLKGKQVDLESFRARLRAMDLRIPDILAAAPDSWQPSYADRVESHLMAAQMKADRFCEAIAWRLAK